MARTPGTLIIQFKTDGRPSDWSRLMEVEETLIQGFSQNRHAVVDGHDFGPGSMNIFVQPRSSWASTIQVVLAYLKLRDVLSEAVVIKRLKSGEHHVVWPEDFDGDFDRG